jgi:1-acyl-sn-glycerol-3-phosphate acyltransferase
LKSPTSFPNPELSGLRLPKGVPGPSPFYIFMRRFFQVTISLGCNIRVYNRHFEPTCGGAVYICNHQSFLDPVLMSFALRRPMSYMARDTLFHVPLFKQFITALNAFPVRRGTADTGAMKEAMRRLKAGGQVVVFAEGTRTLDGRIGRFLPGVVLLAQRSAEWIIPVVIDGAHEAWPRTQMLPSPGSSLVVQYARPIHRDEAGKMDAKMFINHVRNVIVEMQTEVRRRAGRAALKYD